MAKRSKVLPLIVYSHRCPLPIWAGFVWFRLEASWLGARQLWFKLVSQRGRSEYDFTRSGQIPVLVNFAKLLVGFPINRNQFVATSGHFGAAVEIFGNSKNFTAKIYLHNILVHYQDITFSLRATTGSLRRPSCWLLQQNLNTIEHELTVKITRSSAKTTPS